MKSLFSLSFVALLAVPSHAFSYTHACIADHTVRLVKCKTPLVVDGHQFTVRAELTTQVLKQNPAALPDKICRQLGASDFFMLNLIDATSNRNMGFFSKFGSAMPGPTGEKVNLDQLFETGSLNMKAYSIDYGDLQPNGEDVVFSSDGKNVIADTNLILIENTGEAPLTIKTRIPCVVTGNGERESLRGIN